MPKTNLPSYTVLAHQVVQAASEPLPFDEIMRRVQQLRPIDTKNPKGTLRNAISQSRLIVNTGDGRYGWMLRLINGSSMRLTLTPSDMDGKTIGLGKDTQVFLWPTFFEIQSRRTISPIALQLPDGTTTAMELVHLQGALWGMTGPAEVGQWLKTLRAAPGDHLLLRAIDGERQLYAVEFQPRSARDEAAITARNQAVVQAALERLRRSPYGVADWDLIPTCWRPDNTASLSRPIHSMRSGLKTSGDPSWRKRAHPRARGRRSIEPHTTWTFLQTCRASTNPDPIAVRVLRDRHNRDQ